MVDDVIKEDQVSIGHYHIFSMITVISDFKVKIEIKLPTLSIVISAITSKKYFSMALLLIAWRLHIFGVMQTSIPGQVSGRRVLACTR